VRRFLLDTNIISAGILPEPPAALVRWLDHQQERDLFLTSLTVAEIRRGILEMPLGRKRLTLEAWFDGSDGPIARFAGRFLPFDEQAALIWARLMAEGRAAGRPRSPLDTIIAAVAVAHDCVVATANERDFAGVATVNPMRG
jgi:hypothetical protein